MRIQDMPMLFEVEKPKPRWNAERIATYALFDFLALLAVLGLGSLATWLFRAYWPN